MNHAPVIPHEDQPDWMRRAMRGTDWGIIIAFLLGLVAAWPFIVNADLPIGTGTERAVYQTWETAESLREGQLYPRWSAYSADGFGAPIPNFRPPISAYLPALIDVLMTDDPILSVRAIYILSFCIASIGMYSFIMKRLNASAGLIASTLYILSPYVALTVPHALGDLQTMIALALLPCTLWAIVRMEKHNVPFDFAIVTLLTTALFMTDPHYVIFEVLLSAPLIVGKPARTVFTLVIVGLISFMISAMYWLPAILEASYVSWVAQPAPFLLPSLQLSMMFAPISPLDPTLAFPEPQHTLGWAILMTNVLGLGALYFRRRFISLASAYFVFGILLTLGAVTIFGGDIWLLGPITFCFAVSGTSFFFWRDQFAPRYGRIIHGMILVLILLFSSQVFLLPRPTGSVEPPNPQQMLAFERLGYGYARSMPWSLAPVTSASVNNAEGNAALNDNLIRFGRDGRTQSLATLVTNRSHEQYYQIRPTSAQTVALGLYYFPGWQAWVNGRPVELTENPRTGLIDLSLPTLRGPAELHISLGVTPVQLISFLLSFIGLFSMILIVLGRQRFASNEPYIEDRLLSIEDTRISAVAIFLLLAFIFASDTPGGMSPLRATPYSSLVGATIMQNRSDIGLEAFALKLSSSEVRAGEPITATTYWKTSIRLPETYYRRVTLRDVISGSVQWQGTLEQLGEIPTRRWLRDRLFIDTLSVQIPASVASGRYTLSIVVQSCDERLPGTNTCDSENSLTFFDRVGNELGRQLTLAQIITVVDE